MKRVLPIIGALGGAVGLPSLMLKCLDTSRALFPQFSGWPRQNLGLLWSVETNANAENLVIVAGALLGLVSVALWLGKRTFWPRVAGVVCSICALAVPIWIANGAHQEFPQLASIFYERLFLFYLPLITWACALLLFAVLARKRSAPIHP